MQFGGPETLIVDQTMRMLGVNRIAKDHDNQLGAEDREL